MVRGSSKLYEIRENGNVTLSKMSKDPLPRELRINALDIETGQQLWNHVERVEQLHIGCLKNLIWSKIDKLIMLLQRSLVQAIRPYFLREHPDGRYYDV